MKRRRHLLTAFFAGLPLLVLVLVGSGGRGAVSTGLMVVLWAGAMFVMEAVTWRMLAAPVREIMRDLGVDTAHEARAALQSLRSSAVSCESERAEMKSLLEDLTSSLGDGLLVVSSGLEIRLINRVARRFCGVETVALGTHLLEILRNPGAVRAVESAVAGEATDAVIIENRRGLWEVHAFPVRGGGAVVLLTDVGLVRRAAELRQRFVQDLSHELRSPLTVLRTTVEALEDEVDPRLAAMLVHQVERLDRLTVELYDLATIEAGQMELQLENLPVASTVDEVVRDLRPEAERAGVNVRVNADDDLRCWCDRRGLYRILRNLIDNGIKYNRPGGWVEVRGYSDEGVPVFEVEDNGEGIPAAELKAVLQRFYRVDRARTPGDGGLGLGLAIVKHMVQALGGSLELDSREGVGTTVTVRLLPPPREREL
jgi:two-component system phosphate regulon sensor histidine kinase PhoR